MPAFCLCAMGDAKRTRIEKPQFHILELRFLNTPLSISITQKSWTIRFKNKKALNPFLIKET